MIPSSLYHKILENVPIACVDVAIVRRNKILLVRRKDKPAEGDWWLPGGRVLKGEKMTATALRKAHEEVGMQCTIGPLCHTAETIFPDGPEGIAVHSINSCFILYTEDKPELDDHHSKFKWVSKPGACHPYVRNCLEKAFEVIKDLP